MVVANYMQDIRHRSFHRFALLLSRPVLGFVGLTAVLLSLLSVEGAVASEDLMLSSLAASPTANEMVAQEPAIKDGRYLYGEAPEPDQLGKGYMVFEVNSGQIVGALYVPSSSFDCFHGELQGNQLAMTIINSYTQEIYPYNIALSADTTVASTQPGNPAPLQLDGFYRLDNLSDNDTRILNVCLTGPASDL